MNPRHPHLVFALLAISLGLMLFVVACRINGQVPPMPQEVTVTETNTGPDFVRGVAWTRNTDASNYVLTVNTALFMMPAVGTNGATMTASNVPMMTGTNTLRLYACNTNGCGETNMLRYWMSWERSDDYIGWFYSSNGIDGWTPTNFPSNGRIKPRKNGMGYFKQMVVYGTNYIDERNLP